MTNSEAIKLLEENINRIYDPPWNLHEAVYMAIEALEAQQWIPCNQCEHYEGVHGVQGHAPCSFLKCGGVFWNWSCSNAKPYQPETEDE